jgi:hypothetical protein
LETIFLRQEKLFFLSSTLNDFLITKMAHGSDWALRARRPRALG